MYKEKRKLENGVEIPMLALGTWFIDDDKAAASINKRTIQNGLRKSRTVKIRILSNRWR